MWERLSRALLPGKVKDSFLVKQASFVGQDVSYADEEKVFFLEMGEWLLIDHCPHVKLPVAACFHFSVVSESIVSYQ